MGIHFACHHCNHALHVKDFQAGKKGKCPECKGMFRIPMSDATHSLSIDADLEAESVSVVADDEQVAQTLTQSKTRGQSRKEVNHSSVPSTPSLSTAPSVSGFSTSSASPPPASLGANTMPIALATAGAAAWFVRPPAGGQFGPASSQVLWDWIVEKRVTFDSLLWREGMPQWQSAKEIIPEHFGPPKPAAMPPAPPPAPGAAVSPTLSPNTPSVVATLDPSSAMVAGAILSPPPLNPSPVTPAATPGSLAKKKREQKRRKQMTAIVVLSVLSLILLVVLIVVLVMQQSPGTPPANPPATPTTTT